VSLDGDLRQEYSEFATQNLRMEGGRRMNFATDLFQGQRVSLSNFFNPGPLEGVIALRSEDGRGITVKFDKPALIFSLESGSSVIPLSRLKLTIEANNHVRDFHGDWQIEPIAAG
jgi:hypothetical protein